MSRLLLINDGKLVVMKTRLLVIIGIITIGIVILPANASQCISGISLEDNYKNYDHIFSGRVESIDYSNPIKVQFYLHQSWKGNGTDPVIVNTAFSSDPVLGFQFVEGKHYLVFASNSFGGDHPTVTGCSPTKLLSESKDTVLQLQQLTNFTHPLRACTSDRSACFQNELICDPTGWNCGTSEGIFAIVEEPEPTEEQVNIECGTGASCASVHIPESNTVTVILILLIAGIISSITLAVCISYKGK